MKRARYEPGGHRGDGYIPDAGICGSCSKWRYFTRKDAKRAAKKFHPADVMSVYLCPQSPPDSEGFWHFGHLPKPVRAGDASRAEIRNARRTARPRRTP